MIFMMPKKISKANWQKRQMIAIQFHTVETMLSHQHLHLCHW